MQVTRDGKKRRTASEWSALLARQEASGLSLREFARQQSLPIGSLQRWKQRLSSGKSADFVEVSTPGLPAASDWQVEIVVPSGTILRLRG